MEFPEGYEEYLLEKGIKFEASTYCLILKKTLYGLVQAARQWWKKITAVFNKMVFVASKADPCLFATKSILLNTAVVFFHHCLAA